MIFDHNKIINESSEDISNLKISFLSKENSSKNTLKKYFSLENNEEKELDIVNITTVFRINNLKKKILGFIDLDYENDFFSPFRREIYKTSDLILILLENNDNILNEINEWISEFNKEEIFVKKCIFVDSVK